MTFEEFLIQKYVAEAGCLEGWDSWILTIKPENFILWAEEYADYRVKIALAEGKR